MKRSPLHSRLANIKLFLCDVDGVLTDGSIYIGGSQEVKRYNIQDGLGLVLLRREKLSWDEVCYMGDDIVDLGPLRKAGIGIAVANAVAEAKAAADFVTRAAGGGGAVREVIEMILQAQGKWDGIVAGYRE
jgi:3-deoxy-D-manno-octulosonate 8-phosphate phosphatase (KDO 8-P phosphatase)